MAQVDSWAVDLADVGAVYPMQGNESLMVWLVVAIWVVWHVVQIVGEQRSQGQQISQHGSEEELAKNLNKEA